MLNHLFETLIIHFVSGLQDWRQSRRRQSKQAPTPPDDSDCVLGYCIQKPPDADAPPVPVTLSLASRRKHIFITGATGSGKSVLMRHLIAQDIRNRQPCVVLDLSGDFIDTLLPIVAQVETPDTLGNRLLLLDLRAMQEFIVPFNPLVSTSPDDACNRALHVLSILRKQSDSWGVTIDETARNALLDMYPRI